MISAIILAAGKSRRMGRPKMLLPWGNETVLGHVITVFNGAGVDDVVVVTGASKESVSSSLKGRNVRLEHNKDYSSGEMISSIHCGIRALSSEAKAVLIGLGDQPQIQERSIRAICELFKSSGSNIIVPSYQMHRGHPWLVGRLLWDDLLRFNHPKTPRDFLQAYEDQIKYIVLNDPSILADMDTPEEYDKWHKE